MSADRVAKLDPNETADRRRPLGLVLAGYAVCGLVVAALWWTPIGSSMRLFTTFVHELGHLAAAGATGGEIHRIAVNPNGSGYVYQTNGWRFLVSPAGYMGTLAFAAFLFRCAAGRGYENLGIGVVLGLLLLHASSASATFGVMAGLGTMIAAILAVAYFLDAFWKAVALRVLAMCLCLHGILDLLAVLFAFDDRRSQSVWEPVLALPKPDDFYTDATLMAATYGRSEGFWAVAWLALSLLVLMLSLVSSVRTERAGDAATMELRRLRPTSTRKGEGVPHTVR